MPRSVKRGVMIRSVFILVLMLGTVQQGISQLENHVFIGPQTGMMYYIGDLTAKRTPQSNTIHPFGGLSLKVKNLNRFSLKAGLVFGRVSAADSLNNPTLGRDFHFRSNITELQVLGKINFFNHKKQPRSRGQLLVTPGFVAGFSLYGFNPQVMDNGVWINARSLGTEGQFVQGGGYAEPYSLFGGSLKSGIEVNVRLSDLVEVDFFTLYTKTFSDHIDDVGGTYPEVEDLLTTQNGVLAAEYAFRDVDPNNVRKAGEARGNSASKDGFVQIGMTVNFRLTPVPRNRYNSRPAFKRRKPVYF